MSRIAQEITFGSLQTYVYPTGTYDSSKLGLGTTMVQKNGGTPTTNTVGPFQIAVARPVEQSTSIPATYPVVINWSSTVDWIFLCDNATAAATRRLVMYEFNRQSGVVSWNGFATVTFPTGTNHTIQGFRMTYDLHTTGTVAVSGTAVTGTGTQFSTDRVCVGNRIGFGSTDPTQISTWYEISAIGSNTSITLTGAAPTLSAGTAYVIEDLRAIVATKNATATNGGLYVVKGLRKEVFSPVGTPIPAATTVDNIRACYWLKDASTETNINASGCGLETAVNKQTQFIWVLDGTTTAKFYKYNLRAALTLSAGADTTAFQYATGTSATLTGTATQLNNCRLANAGHGPGQGLNCLYFTTSTRIYRTNDVSTITTGSTTFLADNAVEVPPGGVNTFAASSLLQSIEYSEMMDKFFVMVNSTTSPFRSYVTQYRTDGGQWDRVFLTDTRQIDQSTASSNITPTPGYVGASFSIWSSGGLCALAGTGTTAILNRVYLVPTAADWEYAGLASCNQRVIFPKFTTTGAVNYVRAYVTSNQTQGTYTNQNLQLPAEPYRLYYRTTGIDNNSGAWTLLDSSLSLSGVAGASAIQFMAEFRILGMTSIPAQLLSLGVVYDDATTLTNYQPSVAQSSVTSKTFAWRFATAFGGTVPKLYIRLYDAVTGATLLTDDTVAASAGTWQKSTDGSVWGSYNTTDKANETTYIRYTPTSLADNIKVRAVISTS